MSDPTATTPRTRAAAPELVSVVIVTHDNWPDVELAAQSALQQTHQPVEVVVVDNASSDETPRELARRFGDRITYIRQENRFDAGGYNTGIRASSGGYVQLLDGDDFLAPDKIEKQIETFRSDPTLDIVYGDFRQFRLPAGPATWEEVDNRDHDDVVAVLLDPGGNGAGLVTHCALFRREALDRVGDWDETIYSADQDYWLRAAWAGCRFRYCPGSLCFYQRRPEQMSADASRMMRRMEATWEKALGYIDREPYRTAVAENLARLRLYLAVSRDGGMTAAEALERLAVARATFPGAVPLRAGIAARALIVLPGGRSLVRSRPLDALRRAAARVRRS